MNLNISIGSNWNIKKPKNKKIHKIAEHYGISSQLLKLIEEMSEVSKEIIKLQLSQDDREIEDIYYIRLPDELADLSVVLEQAIYLLGCEEKVARNRRYKVERQLERIRNEQRHTARSKNNI